MPRANVPKKTPLSREQIIEKLGIYPPAAFEFVERGLSLTAQKIHGSTAVGEERHITGQELCWGLRDYALSQWGLLARTVLQRWNITCTMDFGRIVYALIEGGLMQKRDEDSIEHFRDVSDFAKAFEADYRIRCDL